MTLPLPWDAHVSGLRPFWRYYGGKFRAAPRYPSPLHATIVEPFAGAAGYSLRYAARRVILVERYAVIAEMWRYLIAATSAEVLRVPLVEHVDDLPAWVPQGMRYLVGFRMNAGTVSPCRQLSAGQRRQQESGRDKSAGWTSGVRARVARQLEFIRHWTIIEGDYTEAPDVEATWFIDPPYNNTAGSYYVHAELDYAALGAWCRERRGQVIACENEGATWLPFRPFMTAKAFPTASPDASTSAESIWTNAGDQVGDLPPAPSAPAEIPQRFRERVAGLEPATFSLGSQPSAAAPLDLPAFPAAPASAGGSKGDPR
jgi:hypothetical protein